MKKAENKQKRITRSVLAPLSKNIRRRTADEIQRIYKCAVNNCRRSYGSYPALYTHIKIKHVDLDQDKIIEMAAKEKRWQVMLLAHQRKCRKDKDGSNTTLSHLPKNKLEVK